MKTILLFFLILLPSEIIGQIQAKQYKLIKAIAKQESNYGTLDNLKEDAIGYLGIRKVFVDDVNRICKLKQAPQRYTYDDRKDKRKSIEMFFIYHAWYVGKWWENYEVTSRNHNGGPKGYLKESTVIYWEKVKLSL